MNNIENVCNKLIISIDGIICVSLVNLKDGSILGSSFRDGTNSQEINDNISSATMEILKNKAIQNTQKYINEKKGHNDKNVLKEIFISSSSTWFFIRILEDIDIAIFVVSNKTSNQGLIWLEIKMCIPKIKELV